MVVPVLRAMADKRVAAAHLVGPRAARRHRRCVASVVSFSTSAAMVSAVFSSSPADARASSAADGMRGMISFAPDRDA